jgi:hypothetical protein
MIMVDIRKVTPNDMPTLATWAQRRGCGLVSELLPPDGFLATIDGKPLMTAWASFAINCPIVYVDHVYLPRRFDIDAAREAWRMIIERIRTLATDVSKSAKKPYLIIEIVMNPVMEREAIAAGGIVSVREYKKCHFLI